MYEVSNVAVHYGAAAAVADVRLRVDDGELVVVVGPNGAGKSTLINAMAGLHAVASGRLVVDGQDITREAPHRFCERGIAIVPEGRRLFVNLSVRENLELGSYRAAARRVRAESMRRVCALFPALAERMEVPAGALSGGQQQMVAIGRALMSRPKMLLLDEPFLGVAPIIIEEVIAALQRLSDEGLTLLLVEQNIHRAMDFVTRAYVIENGRSVLEGNRQTLLGDPKFTSKFLGLE